MALLTKCHHQITWLTHLLTLIWKANCCLCETLIDGRDEGTEKIQIVNLGVTEKLPNLQ